MDKNIGEIIRGLREERGMTQDDLAEAVGVSRNYIAMIEMNKRKGKFVLAQIADKLGVDVEILYGELPIPEYHPQPLKITLREALRRYEALEIRELPILGHPPCGYPLPTEEHAEGFVSMLKDDLGYAREKPGLFALIASGDSLRNDGIEDGCKLIVDPGDKDIIDGKIYVVRTPDNEVTVKHVYRYNGKVKLVPSNAKFKTLELENVEIMGRVILTGNWTRR